MQTWTELVNIVTETLGDDSATTVRKAKRDLNIANNRLLEYIGRETTKLTVHASIVASQMWYQLPENCIRVAEAWLEQNGNKYPLTLIESEHDWNIITANTVSTATYPQSMHIRGNDQIGIYPLPAAAIANGLVISFEPDQVAMANDDYTTGTAAATNGSLSVTGTGTAFTSAMVGRYFRVDADGRWYKIRTVTNGTTLTLDNYFIGNSISGAYTIGEASILPAAYHDSLADYALMRGWQRRKDRQNAADFKALWDESVLLIKEKYATTTSSSIVNARPRTVVHDIFTNTPRAVV